MTLTRTEIITAPTSDPLSLEEVKTFLKIELGETEEDDLLEGLIKTAAAFVEEETGSKFGSQTLKTYYDEWPSGDFISLPYGPLSSVHSSGVTYRDSNGDATVFASSSWEADTESIIGRVGLKNNESWPSETLYAINPISVEYTCGYTSTNFPQPVKTAMKMLISHWYENREAAVLVSGAGEFQQTPMAIRSILSKYKTHQYA